MTLVRLFTITTISLALMAFVTATPAMADVTAEQNQKLEQEIEVECHVTGYGESKCEARGKQTGEQSQKIEGFFRKDGTFVKAHKPAPTALDGSSMAVATGALVLGSAAAYLKVKTRKL